MKNRYLEKWLIKDFTIYFQVLGQLVCIPAKFSNLSAIRGQLHHQ
jgi:hypothetical protein